MTEASPVTTIDVKAAQPTYSSDRACLCHAKEHHSVIFKKP